MNNREISISVVQHRVHVGAEAFALLIVAPWLLFKATDRSLSSRDRTIMMLLGLGTLAVDGYLLTRNVREWAEEAETSSR